MDMQEEFNNIVTHVTETMDEFIFETITPWLSEATKLVVDKKLLIDALIEYRQRHPLRFVAKTEFDKKLEENDDEEI